MKYGLVVYKETANIGDDIQCYAVSKMLPHIDIILDREHLDDVQSDEPIAAVMNGWFLHRKWNWPPASSIIPLYVAFHYSEYERAAFYGKYIKHVFLSGEGGQHLRAWAPIGCRDLHTMEIMRDLGIESYFSGCMTLTLPQMPINEDIKKEVCLVDLEKRAEMYFEREAKKKGILYKKVTHKIEPYAEDVSWDERAKEVEKLLTVYQNARCVVTSRLHCALPCLALGTPVLLVRKDLDNERFQPYAGWMHCATIEQVEVGDAQYDISNPPQNSNLYLETRSNLVKIVKQFTKDAESRKPAEALDEEKILRWKSETMRRVIEENLGHYNEDIKELISLKNRSIINRTKNDGLENLLSKTRQYSQYYGKKAMFMKIKSYLKHDEKE